MPNLFLLLLCLLSFDTASSRDAWVIPRILHHVTTLPSACPRSQLQEVVPGKYLNKALAANAAEMRQMNPNWTYRLWDHQSIAVFLSTHRHVMNYELGLRPDEDVKNIYDSINPHYGSARCDFFRYTLMYMIGGVYMDLKAFSHLPLDKVLQPADGFVAIDEWDQRYFKGWGNFVDDVPGRGKEHPSWFMASAPRHPVIKSVFLRVLAYYRRYMSQCVEYRVCPSGLTYRFRDDNSFDRISWPKKREHCYGGYGTLVMLGPLVFSAGVVAGQHAA
eukprot:EG_transcript_23548